MDSPGIVPVPWKRCKIQISWHFAKAFSVLPAAPDRVKLPSPGPNTSAMAQITSCHSFHLGLTHEAVSSGRAPYPWHLAQGQPFRECAVCWMNGWALEQTSDFSRARDILKGVLINDPYESLLPNYSLSGAIIPWGHSLHLWGLRK